MSRLLAEFVPNLPDLWEMFPLSSDMVSQRENSTRFPNASDAGRHDHALAESLGSDLWEVSGEVSSMAHLS